MFIDQTEREEIVVWTINRPDRFNALGTKIAAELEKALAEFNQRVAKYKGLVIRAVPRTTRNGRIWIAGGDLKELAALDSPSQYTLSMTSVCHQLESLPIPVVAVIEGAAIGGGAEFALAADIRIGAEDSCFDFRQLEIGLATGYGGAKRLIDLVGKAAAQRLMYLPDVCTARQSLALGLLHRTAPADQLESCLSDVLDHLLSLHTPAFAAQKLMFVDAAARSSANAEYQKFLALWRNPVHSATLERFE